MTGQIPHLRLKGTPDEVGYQYGEFARERIQECYRFYTEVLISIDADRCQTYGKAYLEVIAAYLPEAAAEIVSIAKGANMADWQIAFLNARTEIFLRECDRVPVECTSVYFPSTGLLGQNWDWMKRSERWLVLLEVEDSAGHGFLTVTESGMLAKVGMNKAGIGVCMNILRGKPADIGIPFHIILRRLLESSFVKDVLSELERLPLDTYSNVLIANNQGEYKNIEFHGKDFTLVDYASACPIHTNHYLSITYPPEEHGQYQSSFSRYERAKKLCASAVNRNMESMRNLLLDRENNEFAICGEYRPYLAIETTSPVETGTVCSIIMDLQQYKMWVTHGSPVRNTFFEVVPGLL